LFVTLWQFEVKPGSEELFEKAYGPDGEWVQLFRRDPRYRGTRLLRDVGRERVYLTMDEWESRAAYGDFQKRFTAEYAKLDRECEGMMVGEQHLDEFEGRICI
jgi:heme-degrading monooxygenase HmoA